MAGFQVSKSKQGTKLAKNAPVSREISRFKSFTESARKAAFVSLLALYPCAAPMADNGVPGHHPDARPLVIHKDAKMTAEENASLKKLVVALSIFAAAFVAAFAYSNTGKRKEIAQREKGKRHIVRYGDR